MTIEQAISNLKRAKCVPYKKETLEMAIKALEETRWTPVSERLPEPYKAESEDKE